MPRQRQFDEEQLLEQAMITFWSTSFEQTSIRDIASDTGVQAQSLYNTFGNKENLYLKALAHYVNMAGNEIERIISVPSDPWQQLSSLLTLNWSVVTYPKGCMVVNAIGEQHQATSDEEAVYNSLFNHLIEAFKQVLSQLTPQLNTQQSVSQLAEMLLVVHNGLQVDLANGGQERRIETTVNTTLKLLKREE
ncbi:MAG TPA: hypothetical protein DCW31_07205 [Lactobacillus sp.]|nr:hypothetical protein [Lactobacillus sp.]